MTAAKTTTGPDTSGIERAKRGRTANDSENMKAANFGKKGGEFAASTKITLTMPQHDIEKEITLNVTNR